MFLAINIVVITLVLKSSLISGITIVTTSEYFQARTVDDYKRYSDVQLIYFTLPPQTSQFELNFTQSKSSTSCADKSIRLDVRHGGYPVVNPGNTSFPDQTINSPRLYYYTAEVPYSEDGIPTPLQFVSPLQGNWYIAAYLPPPPSSQKITPRDLTVDCNYKLSLQATYTQILEISDLISGFPIKHTIGKNAQIAYFRYYSSLLDRDLRITISNCTSPQEEKQDSCLLYFSVGINSIPVYGSGDSSDWLTCNFTDTQPMYECQWQDSALMPDMNTWYYVATYLPVNNLDTTFDIRLDNKECIVGDVNDQCLKLLEPEIFQRTSTFHTNYIYADPSVNQTTQNVLRLSSNSSTALRIGIRPILDIGGTLNIALSFLEEDITENVTACLHKGSISSESGQDCHDGLQMDISANSDQLNSKWFIPFPEEGDWYLVLWSTSEQKAAPKEIETFDVYVVVDIYLTSCIEGCGSHGTCHRYYIRDLLFSSCSCSEGYSGWGCTDDTNAWHWSFILTSALLLTLSNLFFTPGIIVAFYRRFYAEALVYFTNMFFSSFYHACDANTLCIIDYDTLQFMDFWCSIVSFQFTLVAMAKLKMSWTYAINVAGMACLVFATKYNRFSIWCFAAPIISCFLLIIMSWGYKMWIKRGLYPSKKRWLFFILPGLLLAGIALILYAFVETDDNYYIVHSFWHILISLSIPFLLPSASRIKQQTSESQSHDSTISHELIVNHFDEDNNDNEA